MLDHLLNNRIQLQGISDLDHLPTSVRNYLISCRVEGKSPRTIGTYKMVLTNYFNFDGSNQEITPNNIRQFILWLYERKLSPSTIHIYYRSLKTYFNWLVAEEFISESPMRHIKSPRLPKVIIKPFSREDIDNILLLCSSNKFLEVRNRALVLTFLDTGLRNEEMASLQLSDVNFDIGVIKVMGKGTKERLVRIGTTTQKAMLKYLLMRNDNHPCLWVSEERRPLTYEGTKTIIKKLCIRAGITRTKRGPHTLRHTFAITFLRNGGDIFSLQILLGHSTLEMTRRYVSALGADDAILAHEKASPVDRYFKK